MMRSSLDEVLLLLLCAAGLAMLAWWGVSRIASYLAAATRLDPIPVRTEEAERRRYNARHR